jgi:cytochrome oxidase assembly protein ShyY1
MHLPANGIDPFLCKANSAKKTVLVDNAIYEGIRGFSVYQEFLSNNGLSLLVSKGWSNSFDSSKKTLDKNYLLQGVFRPIVKAYTIDNSIYEREESDLEIQSFDIDSINLKWNTNFPAVVFELDEFSLDGFSRIWQPVYLSANRHFGYAIQWLGLSLVALAGFIFAGFRKND